MPLLDSPLQLSNIFKPKIWGRTNLAPLFNASGGQGARGFALNPLGQGEQIGEVWITDDASCFLNGAVAGLKLAEASEKYGPELYGRAWKGRRFPLLAKYIFTSDWLSVQVHPDDGYARTHDRGNLGKCEMWYIIQADPHAQILLGLKPGATKEKLKAAFEQGRSKELLLGFRPEIDEAIFVPPGTVHALGPGLVLFELEQNSDLTYRLDDFGRLDLDGKPRTLHWAKGFDVMRLDLPNYHDLPRLEFREAYGTRRYVLASRFFALEEIRMEKTASFKSSPERVEVLSILEGEGRVENQAGWFAYRRGETWLIPPAAGLYRFVPRRKTRLLKFYVPDLDEDFRRPLARRRVRPKLVNQIVFA
jgi:mannose-6-phosphate isomerase